MPYCNHCQSEFVEGVTHCSDCERPLTPGPLPEPAEEQPMDDVHWMLLRECNNDLEAELLKQLLEGSGIAVLRKGSLRGSYGLMGSVSTWPGERIYLYVPENQIGRAVRIWRERVLAGKQEAGNLAPSLAERATIVRLRRRKKISRAMNKLNTSNE